MVSVILIELYKILSTFCYMSHCQNMSKFLSIAYFMKTADVIMCFFLHMIGLIILVNGN